MGETARQLEMRVLQLKRLANLTSNFEEILYLFMHTESLYTGSVSADYPLQKVPLATT